MRKEIKRKSMLKTNLILFAFVVFLTVIPLFIAKDAEFEGADGKAEEAILEMNKDYEPWFSPVFQPPSGEVESLIFALQAALGAGIICYFFGYAHGKTKRVESDKR